jgi:acyl-CoA synthetase (AMP-forming)/AMP-acid ligase II
MLLIPDALAESPQPAVFDAARHEWWSYARLSAEVRRLSQALSPAKRLAFCFCGMDIATIVNYLALLEAGHATALIDGALDPALQRRLVELYRPELLVSSRELSFATDGYATAVHGDAFIGVAAGKAASEIHPELAILLSTSGTTGSPKFVRLSSRNLLSNADSIRQALAITPADRAMCSLPFHYSYGLSVLNSHLLAGAAVVVSTQGLLSSEFWSICRDTRCTSMAGVPYSYQALNRLNFDDLRVPDLTTLTQAGGKLNPNLICKFHELMDHRRGRFFVMYGQTEATARMAILPATDLPKRAASAGLPIPGGMFQIEREDGTLTTQAGVRGELVYSGPNVMMGYAATRADLAIGDSLGGVLHTGDLCHLDEAAYLYVSGRMKRDAKVLGLRINLDEVEAILRVHGPTAVLAGSDKLHVFCEYGAPSTLAALRSQLASSLRLNHAAFEFNHIDKLPTTTSGKIDYAALASL